MRKKEKRLLFVMSSLVKMRSSRLVSRDDRIIFYVLPLPMPRAARRAFFKSSRRKKSCRTSCAAALAMPGLFLDADGAYRAALGCGDGLRHLLRRDGAWLCHSQNPLHAEHGGAQPGALYSRCTAQGLRMHSCKHLLCGKHCPFCRKLCLCKRFAVWYNKTAGNRQEEIR